MKKANTIIALVAIAGFSLATSVSSLSNGMNLNKNMKLSMNASKDVYGIQFDMHYNPDHIESIELSSLVNGVDIHSNVRSDGHMRVIMFGMDLNKISSSGQVSDIIDFKVTPSEGYAGTTSIETTDTILADYSGIKIDSDEGRSFEVTLGLVPTTTSLSNAYPNPFNPSTNIVYSLGTASDVSLVIYDMKGALVKTLVSEFQDVGEQKIVWNGKSDSGSQVSSGMYLVRMEAAGQVYQQAVTLLK